MPSPAVSSVVDMDPPADQGWNNSNFNEAMKDKEIEKTKPISPLKYKLGPDPNPAGETLTGDLLSDTPVAGGAAMGGSAGGPPIDPGGGAMSPGGNFDGSTPAGGVGGNIGGGSPGGNFGGGGTGGGSGGGY